MKKRSIVWFRSDLRLHDNEALTDAIRASEEVICVYVFDPRVFGAETRYGFPKTGLHRTRFVRESVEDLRNRLRAIGSELVVRFGHPEDEIYQLAHRYKTHWVFCNRERTRDEVQVQSRLEKRLWSIGQEVRFSRGKMLYYTQDLPFPVTHTPNSIAAFRKEVMGLIPIRAPLPAPQRLQGPQPAPRVGSIPTMEELGHEEDRVDRPERAFFAGGEATALARLAELLHNTKEGLYSRSAASLTSSRLSPWLSHGCLSPKMLYRCFLEAHGDHKTKATKRLLGHLVHRDYHRLMGKKFKNKIFLRQGTGGPRSDVLRNDRTALDAWAEGRTGLPIIDACMRELAQTGYLSTRGRELVSSYLVHDRKVNWQMGADYFESVLLDYDPCSNYGNWNLVAGVGPEGGKEHVWNLASQARILDPAGTYIRRWAPQYADKSAGEIHQLNEACS